MHIDPTIAKVVGGSVLSAFLAVAGVSYNNKSVNDNQDLRIARLEKTEDAFTRLTEQLAQTNQNIAVLSERIVTLKEKLDGLEKSDRLPPR